MKKICMLLLSTVGMASCGDFWELETTEALKGAKLQISQPIVMMSPGDVYKVPVAFTPAEYATTSVFWLSADETVATVRNDSVVAVAEGITRLFAFSVLDNLRDTCYAYVMPSLELVAGRYPYDMVVYAQVDVHGTRITLDNADDYRVIAFVGNEVRGVGQMRQHNGTEYMELRIWGNSTTSDEQVELRCYMAKEARIEVFAVSDLTFDGQQHGSLKHPVQLVLDDSAKAYVPDIEDDDDDNPIIDDGDKAEFEADDNDFPDDDEDDDD